MPLWFWQEIQTVSRKVDISEKTLHVLVLVLENQNGEILVGKRPKHKPQGGLWEFPGGKKEKNETPKQALQREIKEELGYTIKQAKPFICVHHDYGNYRVKLDVWYGRDLQPKIHNKEQQQLKWVPKEQLKTLKMPAADQPIVAKICHQD